MLYTCTVQPSTKKTYSSAERRWFSVAESIGTDPCMKHIPLEWQNCTDRFQYSTMTWPEACMTVLLVSFTTGRALAPRTASSYLSAVKKIPREPRCGHKILQTLPIYPEYKAGINTCLSRTNQQNKFGCRSTPNHSRHDNLVLQRNGTKSADPTAARIIRRTTHGLYHGRARVRIPVH